ncbi:hypothetical protein KAR91_12730 [Candidatus Pacearchaeota archaeon]|nr:hypothetical protein [Candidatus Pacearchaeota archaeon]
MNEFVPEWHLDCGGDLDSSISVLTISLFTHPDGTGGAYLYRDDKYMSPLIEERIQTYSQAEAQVWCQNKAREWSKRIERALTQEGLLKDD